MAYKNFKVYFARTKFGQDGTPIDGLLDQAFTSYGHNLPVIELSNREHYQFRGLERVGRVWKGCFAKLRDDAPHVVSPSAGERQISLAADEFIIEKSYFLYRELENVLVWQVNRNAGAISRAEEYLGLLFQGVVTLPQVMNSEDLERVLRGELYELEFSYDRPKIRSSQTPTWNQTEFDIVNLTHAAHAKYVVRAPRRGGLIGQTKDYVRHLFNAPGVNKIRVKLTDDMEPIDLFAAPLKDSIRVQVHGLYPSAGEVYSGLEEAYDRHAQTIEQTTYR